MTPAHRILYVQAAGERGGLEVILLNVLRSLDRTRFLSFVACLHDGPFVKELREAEVSVLLTPIKRVRAARHGVRALRDLVRFIRREQIALVHSNDAVAHLFGGTAARIAGVPSVLHLHGVPRRGWSRDGAVSRLSSLVPASRIVAVSRAVADEYARVWPRAGGVAVIHNGIDIDAVVRNGHQPEHHSGGSGGAREELAIPETAPVVMMVARLQRWKGVHVFVQAAAEIQDSFPDAHFVVVGGALFGLDRAYPSEVVALGRALGVRRLQFTAFRPDVYRFMRAADIIVHCSIEPDPFPTVILEAMALGKPVVASAEGGPAEIVVDGETGFLVPSGRPDRLAERVQALLANGSLRQAAGEAGRRRVARSFSVQRMVSQLEDTYLPLVRRAGTK